MDAIRRKIRSLLAVAAAGSGATDAERETAKRLADALMRKHGLSESDIPHRQVELPRSQPPQYRESQWFVIRRYASADTVTGTTNTSSGFTFEWM